MKKNNLIKMTVVYNDDTKKIFINDDKDLINFLFINLWEKENSNVKGIVVDYDY